MRFLKFFTLLSLLLPTLIFASTKQKITLKDNSVIYGTVTSMANGVYTIKTDSFGVIKLASDKIISITNSKQKKSTARIKANDRPTRFSHHRLPRSMKIVPQSSINAKVKNKMTDGTFVNQVLDLSESSNLNNVMSDPELMDAISNNDYDYLMNSDKINQLMNSPEIKNLLSNFE